VLEEADGYDVRYGGLEVVYGRGGEDGGAEEGFNYGFVLACGDGFGVEVVPDGVIVIVGVSGGGDGAGGGAGSGASGGSG